MLMLCALQRRSAHLSAPGVPVSHRMRRPWSELLTTLLSLLERPRHRQRLSPRVLVVSLQRT